MDLTLHQLRCFLAVAHELHFARAAAQQHLSPSSLSEQIASVERVLERKLFTRSARSVALTREGEELLPLAKRVVSAADEVSVWAKGTEPVLHIGVTTASSRLRAILRSARERMPHASLRLQSVGFSGGIPAVQEGRVDCALTVLLPTMHAPAGVTLHELWDESLLVALPESHWLAGREHVSVKDLWGDVLLAPTPLDEASEADNWYGTIDRSLVEECEVAPLVSSVDETMEMVAAGMGINIAGESALELYARPGVVFVPLESEQRPRSMLAVRSGEPAPLLREFITLARTTSVPSL